MNFTVHVDALNLTVTMDAQRIESLLGGIVTALDDLKKAVSDLSASTSAEIAAVQARLSAAGGDVPAAEAEAIVAQLGTLKTTLDNETAALTGTAPQAPPPGP